MIAGADETVAFLRRSREEIVARAALSLGGSHVRHYEAAGQREVRRRLERLYDVLVAAAASRDLGGVIAFAEQLARERFDAGYDLSEVQAACNGLEEAAWSRAFLDLPPDQYGAALGLISTVLGTAKDALARTYVSLATHTHAPALDLQALSAGTERA